jgi:hypothetical protein
LLKIILPISFIVRLLDYSGVLGVISTHVEPVFAILGLPGETAIVFLTSIFSPLYAPIALISSMTLGVREATILSIMCLVSHNLIIESSVQAKTGSNFWMMITLRLLSSLFIAFILNIVMPHGDCAIVGTGVGTELDAELGDILLSWITGSTNVIITIIVIVTSLMILHYILEEFRLMRGISSVLSPLMKLFGLSGDSAFLWLVGNLVGLAYGGAIMVEQVEQKKLTLKDGNLLNYHLAISHSLLEDTLIFVAIGIPALWIISSRLLFAAIVVWCRRLIKHRRREDSCLPIL